MKKKNPAKYKQTIMTVLIILTFFIPVSVRAQQENSSSSAANSLKDRIEKAVEKKETTEKKVRGSSRQTRGFIGQITRVSQEALTIENSKGTQIIPLEEQVNVTKDDKPIAIKDIAVDEWAVVMGFTANDDNFEPRKIIIKESQLMTDSQIVMLGTLIGYDNKSLTIRSRQDQTDYKFELSRTTDIEDDQGEAVKFSQLFEEMQLLVVGLKEVDEDKETETIKTLIVRSLAPIE